MRRSLLLTFAFLAFANASFSQGYFISKLVGRVYHDGKQIHEHETLPNLNKLRAESKAVAMRIVDPNGASIPISFASGKAVQVSAGDQHSELYELTVGDYIKQYNTYKQTQGKGAEKFDWFNFFYLPPEDSLPRKMLIVEEERIPKQTMTSLKASPFPYIILATIYPAIGDSSSFELPVKQDSIIFPAVAFVGKTPFQLKVDLRFKLPTGGIKVKTVTDTLIPCEFLTTKELDAVISIFSTKWRDTYKTTADAEYELYTYLMFNYSKIYWPQIKQRADAAFQ